MEGKAIREVCMVKFSYCDYCQVFGHSSWMVSSVYKHDICLIQTVKENYPCLGPERRLNF
jgi:hypothetical protein